ncbi:MAG: AI-2E family transporter [Roseicyclus sp.]
MPESRASTPAASPRTAPRPEAGAPRRLSILFGLGAAILAILSFAALRALAPVAIPVMLAVFVTLAVLPLVRALVSRLPERLGWLGRVAIMLLLLAVLTLFLGGLAFAVTEIATNLPDVSDRIDEIMPPPEAEGPLADTLAALREAASGEADSLTERFVGTVTGLAQGIAGAMGAALAGMALVLFLILLALSEAPTWERKLDAIASGSGGTWRDVTHSLATALQRFVVTRAVVGVISTIAYTAWLAPFGIDLLTVWAILVFLMNFIPNIGAVISGVFPTIYAFLTMDPGTALLIGAGLIVIEQVLGNWVDPRLQGKRVAISPLVVLVAVVFWGWLWGVAGAFLGTPMTLAIMIVCNAIPPLRPVALLLSNQPTSEDLDEALTA